MRPQLHGCGFGLGGSVSHDNLMILKLTACRIIGGSGGESKIEDVLVRQDSSYWRGNGTV
jgi:hypothetical protein